MYKVLEANRRDLWNSLAFIEWLWILKLELLDYTKTRYLWGLLTAGKLGLEISMQVKQEC